MEWIFPGPPHHPYGNSNVISIGFLVLETCYPWKFSIPSVGREYEAFLEQHIAYEYELTMGLLFSPSSTHNPCTHG